MDEIKSIWDGWNKQCFGIRSDGKGGNCALGFVCEHFGWDEMRSPTIYRVAAYIQRQFTLPDVYEHLVDKVSHFPNADKLSAIIYANNELKLTPEQFREIDRKTQVDEIAKNLLATVVEETNVVRPDVSAAAL